MDGHRASDVRDVQAFTQEDRSPCYSHRGDAAVDAIRDRQTGTWADVFDKAVVAQ